MSAQPAADRARKEDRRAARKRLSRHAILAEALALIDEEGLAALTMRRLAERLSVEAMSLYHYVQNRDAVIDGVVEVVVDELSADPEVQLNPTDGWEDYLRRLAHGVRRFALGHPRAFPLVATRPPSAPWVRPPLRSLRWIEAFLVSLQQKGFDEDSTLYAYRAFTSFLLGTLLLETGSLTAGDPATADGSFTSTNSNPEDPDPDPSTPVAGQLSPTRRGHLQPADDPVAGLDPQLYPTIVRLAPQLAENRAEDEFHDTLEAIIERIHALPGVPA